MRPRPSRPPRKKTRLVAATCLILAASALAAQADPVRVEAGGEAKLVPVRLSGAPGEEVRFELAVEPDAERLHSSLVRRDGNDFHLVDGAYTVASPADDLYLRIWASGCCDAGRREVTLRVLRDDTTVETAVLGLIVAPSLWACAGPWIYGCAIFLGVFLLTSSFLNSRFLPFPKTLGRTLRPLRLRQGEPRPDPHLEQVVIALLRQAMQPQKRFFNWLRANPFRFCWPGRRYRESLALTLAPGGPAQSVARLIAEPELGLELEAAPQAWSDRFYAVATERDRADWFTVLGKEGRVGGLHRPGTPTPKDWRRHTVSKETWLRRGLLEPDQEGQLVGWRFD